MNEWEFTADVASWINERLAIDASLPFSRAKCEQRGKGSQKRRDLTLLDKDRKICLTGEVKLPYNKDGGSPYNASVVRDARIKARRAKTRYFFTWNVNEFVLWETADETSSLRGQNYKSWPVVRVHRERQLDLPMTSEAVKKWLNVFLVDFAKLLRGAVEIGLKSPDEKFIDALESSLNMPILLNLEELSSRYRHARFKSELDNWMRGDQGWIIFDDPEGIQQNLIRASKFACYALVNKLVFHEALLKRYGTRLGKLSVPDHLDSGEGLRNHLEGYFAEAKNVTGDYETVFGEVHTNLGNRIPFYSDGAVSHWRELVSQIHEFDFSRMDYEVIGSIFERLISPEERHKFGQFYTRVEVVDLINSFCIQRGDELVMDPACGGGTFLVRAYARKRELAPGRKHGELLCDLFGVDVSHFATHLTTINLATRDLIDDENYPQIIRSDFFDVDAHKSFICLPRRAKATGLGSGQHRNVEFPPLDAVVGNPPYVRQEDIRKAKKSRSRGGLERGTKEYYRSLVATEAKARLSGRSDIHCYFWPHATTFLKEGGYLCFLTSSQWLDVEYGFRLQGWILSNFRILAILESIGEPWFIGARVGTAITILQRELDGGARMDNCVRFVQLRQPIRDILSHDGTAAGAVRAADYFRDEILSLSADTVNARYRARVVRQGDLWDSGVRLREIMVQPDVEEGENEGTGGGDERTGSCGSAYYGGKWGVYLRAPDLWFEILDMYGRSLVPLGEIADVRFGVKSGKDAFFLPRDCTSECLERCKYDSEFTMEYGLPRRTVVDGHIRLVRCGEKLEEIRPIEAEYLESEIHSLMEVDEFVVRPATCSRSILLAGRDRESISDKHVLRYIEWGESQGYHKNPTCASRATEGHEWYDLTQHSRPDIVLPKIQQYRLLSFLNPAHLYQNSSLLGIYDVPQALVEPLCAILNSTFAIVSRLVYARMLGNEGNIQLDVYSAKMMLVPNVAAGKKTVIDALTEAFRKMCARKAIGFLSERRLRAMTLEQKGKAREIDAISDVSELDMSDRFDLDDAAFRLLGVTSRKQRHELIGRMYTYLREYFEWTRQKEEKAIINKNKARRHGVVRPEEIALQVYQEICDNVPHLLRRYDSGFLDKSKPFDTYDLPLAGTPELHRDMYSRRGVNFKKGKKVIRSIDTRIPEQDEVISAVAASGVRGLVRVPCEKEECNRIFTEFSAFVKDRDRIILELVEQRTADEDIQVKIREALLPLLHRHVESGGSHRSHEE